MMEAKEIKRLSRKIRTQFNANTVELKTLQEIIKKQGYTIIEFDSFGNDADVSIIIEKLDLLDFVSREQGFTYVDSECRLVFIRQDLSEQEKVLVLAHEEGHIVCNHMEHAPILGKSVIEEGEANLFAHFLLYPQWSDSIQIEALLHRKIIAICCMICFILITAVGVVSYINKQASYYGEFYITVSGTKYHERECIHIKEKKNIRRLTIEEFDSGLYEPCQVCLPSNQIPD